MNNMSSGISKSPFLYGEVLTHVQQGDWPFNTPRSVSEAKVSLRSAQHANLGMMMPLASYLSLYPPWHKMLQPSSQLR